MSDEQPTPEPTPEEKLKQQVLDSLKPSSSSIHITYAIPAILLDRREQGEFVTQTIRDGKRIQLEHVTETEFVFDTEPTDEKPLRILAKNRIQVDGQIVSVLNDDLPNLPASEPSASEFMARSGQKTLVAFTKREIPNNPGQAPSILGQRIWHIHRIYVTFP